LALAGCGVERRLIIHSDPEGALVYLNHEEVGRTPVSYDFTWYGQYDVQLRKEGYQTVSLTEWVVAPWWQWPPFDFVAEITPGRPRDTHRLSYAMRPATRPADPAALVRRAEGMRAELRSGEYTRTPSTAPTTRPTTKPAKKKPAATTRS
jgi:hypothetical protein